MTQLVKLDAALKLTIFTLEDKTYLCTVTVSGAALDITSATLYFSIKENDTDPEYLIHKSTGTAANATKNILTGNAQLNYTADTIGITGNDISITYEDPADVSQAISVTVTETVVGFVTQKNIVVSLATDATGTITSTANNVKTAIEANTDAAALVNITVPGTGASVVTAVAQTFLTGGVSGGITITDASAGEFTITVPRADTADIPAGVYIYDIAMIRNSKRTLLIKQTAEFIYGVSE